LNIAFLQQFKKQMFVSLFLRRIHLMRVLNI